MANVYQFSQGGPLAPPPSRRIWLVVAMLTLAYLLSYVDRQILALLIEPIKADLAIDDLRFSFLTGLAFSVFFALAGLPLGWASDVFRRNQVIAGGVLCWSLATIGSGLAQSYGQIFIARVLVGIGEAALTPAAYSLLADVVPAGMLGRAIAVFSMGSQFGAATAYLGGGVLIAHLSAQHGMLAMLDGMAVWKQLFVLVGLPGLVLAPAILMLVRDPRRAAVSQRASLRETLDLLAPERDFLIAHYAGFTALAATFFAVMAWLPAILARRFSLDPAHLGWYAGWLVLACCPLGTLSAGWIGDRMTLSHGRSGAVRAALVGAALMAVAMVVIGLTGGGPLFVAGLALALFVAPWPLVHASMALQTAVPARLRAQVTALFLLICNLVGQTGGVSLVALVTERGFGHPDMVHRSLALVGLLALALSLWPLARAARGK